jgi:hypothetical protein
MDETVPSDEEIRVTPRELLDQALLAKDMTAFADLWAVDGVLEFPFAPSGYIAVITVRDDQIRHYRDYWNPPPTGDADAFVSAGSGDRDA